MLKKTDEIISRFEGDFSCVREKFRVLILGVDEAAVSEATYVWHPGVYVWFHPEKGVLKVGRHFVNSRKRALEHLRDDTGGVMKSYGDKTRTRLLLFNVKEPEAYHWVAAVEVFLEKVTEPYVQSKRHG